MALIDMAPTLENYKKARSGVKRLLSNPHCDHKMFMDLKGKLRRLNAEIEKLEN